jgi:hypothetical protein
MPHLTSDRSLTPALTLRTRLLDDAVVSAYIHDISRRRHPTWRSSARPIRLRTAARRRAVDRDQTLDREQTPDRDYALELDLPLDLDLVLDRVA